jgi:putative ABC transport system permease protein
MARPPRLARALVRLLVRRDARDVILGDLDEDFRDQLRADTGLAAARRRYWRLALGSLASFGRDRLSPDQAVTPDGADGVRAAPLVHLWQDVRQGLRLLARSPGFAATSILTLAIGIGANTAIFAVAWQVILRPMPYPEPDRLVTVWEESLRTGQRNTVMPANYRDWEREATAFQALAAFGYFQQTLDLSGQGEPEQWRTRYVTARYFDVFGMPPLIGRPLQAADAARPTAVLSERSWRRRFGADPAILNREIRLSDRATLVVGVMPARFVEQAGEVDAWLAFDLPPEAPGQRLTAHYLGVVGRLKPGVTVGQADAEVRAIAARALERFPRENENLSARVMSVQEDRGERIRTALRLLALSAAAVLLIACVNIGTLQASRTAARTRELSIRASLGASRTRLAAQLVTESLLLAAFAGVTGVLVSRLLLGAFQAVYPTGARAAGPIGLDPVILAFAAGLALLGALAFAAWPAWRAGANAARWLGRRGDTGDRRARRVRAYLVAVQIGLAVVLLTSATTLAWSLRNVLRVDPGFEARGVLTFDASLRRPRLDTFAKRQQVLDSILAGLRTVPGVTAACAINEIPFDPSAFATMTYVPEGQEKPVYAAPRTVSPGCLELLRVRLLRGRTFTERDARRLAVVTQSFAQRAWPGGSAVGQRVHVGVKEGPLLEVVGVVADTSQRDLTQQTATVLYELAVEGSAFLPSRVLVRTLVPPESVFAGVRAAVRRVDPDQPVANLRTLDDLRAATVAGRQLDLSLVALFTIMALALSAVGIYGLLAQSVTQRTREIGVRLAVGATPASVVALVMRAAWVSVGVGAAVGLAGAYYAARLLQSFAFGISPTERSVYASVVVGVAALAMAAAWIAARRAARIDPVRTLSQ